MYFKISLILEFKKGCYGPFFCLLLNQGLRIHQSTFGYWIVNEAEVCWDLKWTVILGRFTVAS